MILKNLKATSLAIIDNDKGSIMHGLKVNDIDFKGFGEIYFSEIYYGKIKGWKRHLKMTMNLVVPVGLVKFVFYDSNFEDFVEYKIGMGNYYRITVPPGLWFAFQGLDKKRNLVMNISDIVHDPLESEKKGLLEVEHNWKI